MTMEERAREFWKQFQINEGVNHHTVDDWPIHLLSEFGLSVAEQCAKIADEHVGPYDACNCGTVLARAIRTHFTAATKEGDSDGR